jgi:SAM-dependent methyltransferase
MTELSERTGTYGMGVLRIGTPHETDRLRLIAEVYDPHTLDHLARLGIGAGWHCLEVGAGAGTVARMMADRVGAAGSVIATDLDTGPMGDPGADNIEVLRHDVTADSRPGGPFDLIHCRFVLEHLRERDAALHRLASWLAPGGWLLVETALGPLTVSDGQTVDRFASALYDFLVSAGIDLTWSRALPLRLEAAGLVDVTAQGRCPGTRGGGTAASLLRTSFEVMREPVLAGGFLTAEEFDAGLSRYEDPRYVDYGPLVIAASGRRPTAPSPDDPDAAWLSSLES